MVSLRTVLHPLFCFEMTKISNFDDFLPTLALILHHSEEIPAELWFMYGHFMYLIRDGLATDHVLLILKTLKVFICNDPDGLLKICHLKVSKGRLTYL
jgi:hypothetical protein